MANMDELYAALQAADAAGNTDDARQIAGYIRSIKAPQEKPAEESGDFMRGLKSYGPQTQELLGGAQAVLGAGAEKAFGKGDVSNYLLGRAAQNIQESNVAQQETAKETDSLTGAWSKGIGSVITEYLPYIVGQGVGNIGESLAFSAAGSALGTAVAPGPGTVIGAAEGLMSRTLIKKGVAEVAEKILKEKGKDAAEAYVASQAKKALTEQEFKDLALIGAKKYGSNVGTGLQAATHGLGEVGSRAAEQAMEEGKDISQMDLSRVGPAAVLHAGADYIATKIGLGALDGLAAPTQNFFLNIAKGIGVTGLKELPPELLQTALERFGAGLPIDDKKAIREYIDTAGAAFGMSVLPGGFGGAMSRVAQAPTPTSPPAALEQAPQEQAVSQAPTGGLSADRAAKLRAEADAEAAAKAPKLALEMNQPFTPVALPDGSVALTKQDLDNYEREQFEKQYAPQPNLNQAVPAATPPQLGYSPLPGVPKISTSGNVALTPEQELQAQYAPQPVAAPRITQEQWNTMSPEEKDAVSVKAHLDEQARIEAAQAETEKKKPKETDIWSKDELEAMKKKGKARKAGPAIKATEHPENIGVIGTDDNGLPIPGLLSEGAKPFISKDVADYVRKNQPTMKSVQLKDGSYVLSPKTEAEMSAQDKSKIHVATSGAKGEPIDASAFIAGRGGLSFDTQPDVYSRDENPKIGNRNLFQKNGVGLDQAGEMLQQAGYFDNLPEGESYTENDVIEAITGKKYRAEDEAFLAEKEAKEREQAEIYKENKASTEVQMAEDMGYPNTPKGIADSFLERATDQGIDVESIQEQAAREAQGQPEDAYHDRVSALAREAMNNTSTLYSVNKENKPKKATAKEIKMQKDLEGKSMVQAAQYLIANAPDSFQKFVAKKVLNVMQEMQARGVDLHFEVQTGNTRNGKLYNAEGLTNHIFGKEGKPLRINLLLNGAPVFENQRGYPSGLSYKTLMHEMLHAATSAKIYYLSDTHPAVKELNDLYKLVAEEYKKQRRDGTLPEFLKRFNKDLNNSLENPSEMLTWSMTDKDMQQWMSGIKVGDKTVFSKIIDLIRQVLGISKPFETAFDRLVRTTDSLLDMDIQVLEDGVIAKGHTFGKREPAKKMPSYQQTLFSKRAQQLFMEDELTNKLQFGKKEEPTPTASGQKSLDSLASVMGRTVKPPEAGQIERLNKAIKEANKNKQETINHYKSVGEKHLAYLETKIFSSDAAIQREYEKQIRAMGETDSVKMGMLMSLRTSQAVHHEGVAGVFLRAGDLDYEQETHKWKGKESKDNFKALAEQIQEMRKRNNFSQEQADLIYHTALETKQVAQMIEQNKTLPADKQKVIHITDPNQLAVGMQLFKDHPELNKAVEIWNGIRRNAVEVMIKGGLYSRADAEFLLDNTDYVPMYREMDPEADGGPVTAMRGLRAEKDKKRTGSMRAVNDIFDNQIRWVEYAISRSVKAYQARTMMDAAVDFGIATKFNPQVTPASRMKNVVKIWRGGNEEHYSMEDPLFMDAFVGLQSAAIPMFKWAAKMSNMLRESVVLYPLFSVSQVIQDSIAAVFSSGLKPQYALKIPVLAVKELFKTMRNTSANHAILKQYASVGVQDVNATVVRVNAEQMLGMKGKPGFLGAIKKQLNNFAMAADNSVRQATYQAALDSGLSHSEALEKSFEIFNVRRRGTSKKLAMAGQVIPFFPAYLAAQNVAYNILMGRGSSPTQRAEAHKTLAQTTASVMVLSMLYAMMNGDDDDYLKKPTIQRDRLLMIPGTGGISIPMRSDVFLFPKILAEHTYLMLTDKGYEDGRKFRESMYNALVNSVSSPTVVPQIFKPALEVYVNYDFFQGRPVIGTYQKSKETAYKFNEGTSELSKALGQTGLIAPINADHLIRGMFGSVGGLTLYITNQLIDYANPNSERTSMSTQDMIATLPGTSAFVSKSSESALKRDFYALKEEVDKVTNTFNDIKKNNPSEVPDFIASPERMARIGLSKTVNKIGDQLGKINTAIKQINNNPNLTGDQKQQQIETLRNAENQMLKGVDVKRLREMGMM